ncbi:MAG: hypothetical protein KDI06_18870 [Calditrichaeota bacterium]|nr:hypothetical protein [Calditrichota bacterium]HQU72496.1 hypothetical protein [Calditrichia bacterium]
MMRKFRVAECLMIKELSFADGEFSLSSRWIKMKKNANTDPGDGEEQQSAYNMQHQYRP